MPHSPTRYVVGWYEGVHYQIPELWLQGRALTRERAYQEDPRTAIQAAIADWAEQVRLEGWSG